MRDDSSPGKPIQVEEYSFNTIFGTFEGHRIYASRKVVEKIEMQTRYAAELITWYDLRDRKDIDNLDPFGFTQVFEQKGLLLTIKHNSLLD